MKIKELFSKKTPETESVSLSKSLDVLNYTPVKYSFSDEYTHFINNADEIFTSTLDKVSVDEMNDEMFDHLIRSTELTEKRYAERQKTEHVGIIDHLLYMISGQLLLGECHLKNLEEDKKQLEEELSELMALKRELKIR